mgnify:FL=1
MYAKFDMDDTRDKIIKQAVHMAVSAREIPSLNDLARASGVSKGGLMHHFPSRQALLEAIAHHGITSVDRALEESQDSDSVLRTWLELSLPGREDVALFQALASVFFASKSSSENLAQMVTDANQRWEHLLDRELGSISAARVARLLGDGLLMGVVSGTITSATADQHLAVATRAVQVVADAKQ